MIAAFDARSERTDAPVLATLGWNISDPNRDVLTCRIDTDGDGQLDREVLPCSSIDTVLTELDTAGERTFTLQVDDGSFPPVTAQTSLDVADGPDESYEITLRLDDGMDPVYAQAFSDAAARWESIIAAGVEDMPLDLPEGLFPWAPAFSGIVDDVLIDASANPIDGPGKVLGRAGGLLIREPQWQPYYGVMEFDSADLAMLAASDRLDSVIVHEMGHVLGLGSNWLLTGKVVDLLTDPAYNGRAGVAAHQELGGRRFVPLENEGGLGTAVGHWRESVFGNELMTGYLGQGDQPLSRITVAALADQGYGVDLDAADPYSIPLPSLRGPLGEDHDEDQPHTEPIAPFLDGLTTS